MFGSMDGFLAVYAGVSLFAVLCWWTFWFTSRWMELGDNPFLVLCDFVGGTFRVALLWPVEVVRALLE